MSRVLIHTIFIIGFSFITFFGIGPVLFADGTMNERIITLIIVILIYIIWSWVYRYFIRRIGPKQ